MPALMKHINTISRCATLYRAEMLEDTDLGSCQPRYIIEIAHNPGISQDELARRVYVNKSRVSRNLARLEEGGYIIRRQSDSDRRITCVYPTDKLNDILPRVRAITQAWNEMITADLSAEELELFSAMLEKVSVRARAWADARESM